MQCPTCSIELIKKKIPSGGIFWQCPGCNGRAATLPLLRRQVDPTFIRTLWQQTLAGPMVAIRNCPCCTGRMREISGQTGNGDVVLDICTSCQMIWFDPGEIDTLPAIPPPSPATEAPLAPEVRERLALLKIETMQQPDTGFALEGGPAEWWQWLPGVLGLPVELNQSAVTQRPWYTWGLALLITVISGIGFLDLEATVAAFGLIPAHFERHFGLTLLSSFFLHGGILHLVANLYFFLIFADNVEDYLGRDRFLLLLLSSLLLGDFLHILADPHATIPCVGASGGISGLLAFYTLQFPHARLGFFLRISSFHFHGRWCKIPVWLWFAFWVALQFVGLWLQLGGRSNISACAHLGGAGAGIAFWFWIKHIEKE